MSIYDISDFVIRTESKNQIMKNILHFLCLFTYCFQVSGQCPPTGEHKFKHQSEIDAFLSSYPDCEVLDNHVLTVYLDRYNFNDPIHSFDSWSKLKEIDVLLIEDLAKDTLPTSLFTSFRGLENVEYIHSLSLQDIEEIRSLEGLEGLRKVGYLGIYNCKNLVSAPQLTGVEITDLLVIKRNPNLESVGQANVGIRLDYLDITENPKLEGLEFLSTLTSIGQLLAGHDDISFLENLEETTELFGVYGNDDLTDLSAFKSLKRIEGNLHLENLSELENLEALNSVDCHLSSLTIYNSSLTSLAGLEVRSDLFSLRLNNNPFLENLDAISPLVNYSLLSLDNCPLINDLDNFSAVDSVSALRLVNMSGLTNLQGLNNLKNVTGGINISFNQNLLNFDGLQTLEEVGIYVSINDNNSLQDIDAMINAQKSGSVFVPPSLSITNNPELTTILGLGGIFYRYDILQIVGNPKLAICNIPAVCTTLLNASASDIRIQDNALGCESSESVEAQCGEGIQIRVFYDRNQNGMDDDEPALSLGKLEVNSRYTLLPNSEGNIAYFPFPGINDLSYVPEQYWETTTEDFFQIDSDDLPTEILKIGIFPTETIDGLNTYLIDDNAVCGMLYDLVLVIENSGTTTLKVSQDFVGLGEFVSASFPTSSINGEEVSFEIDELLPGQKLEIEMVYMAPDIDDFPLGSFYNYVLSSAYSNDQGEDFVLGPIYYEREFLCAYDPNDKSVHPPGVQDENYTLINERLHYTIRFQNTGNYFAQNVSVEDTLDTRLDPNTFHFVGASHEVTEIKLEDRSLAFVFNNIFLPDSVNNEPESHGFISYTIEPMSDIAENTVIQNTAHIYFDSNPAIVTNTTLNTFVSEIPGSSVIDDSRDDDFHIIPNPASTEIHIMTSEYMMGSDYSIHDVAGRQVMYGHAQGIGSIIDVSQLDSGLYLLRMGGKMARFVVD